MEADINVLAEMGFDKQLAYESLSFHFGTDSRITLFSTKFNIFLADFE